MHSEPSQKYKKLFFSFQKLAQVSGKCINFTKERIITSVATEMFKTKNHCETPEFVDATDSTLHLRKRGLRTLKKTLKKTLKRTLKRTLSLRTLKRTLKRTLSLRALKRFLSVTTLKRTLSLSTLKRTQSLRTLKGLNQTLTPPYGLKWKQ